MSPHPTTMTSPDASAPSDNTSRIEDVAEFVKRMCLAMTQVEIFAITHPIAHQAVQSAFQWLSALFSRRSEPVVISVSDRKIIMDGMPLEDKNPLVAKLGVKLDAFHVNNLFLEPGITTEEFIAFYEIIGKGSRRVAEQGGLVKMLADAGIQHIRLRDVSYVMVTEDQRVVGRDNVVTASALPGGISPDADIIRFMISKVLTKAEEQQWLLSEIKNNPARMAGLIVEGIELAASRAEMGLDTKDASAETLLNNIKLVAAGLTESREQGDPSATADFEKTILSLENEVRMRSTKLMSSKVAEGFLNEILGLVTSYSDRIRARQITDEFLKGEKSLRRAEKLLRNLAPGTENRAQFVERITPLLAERGMGPDDVARLAESAVEVVKPRKSRRPVAQRVEEGVLKRLENLGLDPDLIRQVTTSMSVFVEERARDKAAEFREVTEQLQGEMVRRTHALETIPWGIVLWDEMGAAVFCNTAAKTIMKAPEGVSLRPALGGLLTSWTFPLKDVPDFPPGANLSEAEIRLVLSVFKPLLDADSRLYGVILIPDR